LSNADGLQPSGMMYARRIKLALPAARAMLRDTRNAPVEPGG
jgi:hypothetical protein